MISAVLLWSGISAYATFDLVHRHNPIAVETPPPELRAHVEDLRLRTSDGESLGAWFVKGDPARPVVVVMHGHWASRSGEAALIDLLADDGNGVMAVTERANGDSSGQWCDVGWSSRNDVIAAVDDVERRAPGRPIVVYGSSMGAAAATFAAGQLGHRIAAYVLDAPYLDLERAIWVRVRAWVPAPMAWFALASMRAWAPLFLTVPLHDIAPLAHAADIPRDIPVLLLEGAHDPTIPVADAKAMAAALGPHATTVSFPHAGHTDALTTDAQVFHDTVLQFIRRLNR